MIFLLWDFDFLHQTSTRLKISQPRPIISTFLSIFEGKKRANWLIFSNGLFFTKVVQIEELEIAPRDSENKTLRQRFAFIINV